MTLLLASQSSGRAAMLRAAGLEFETTAAHVDEEALTASLIAAGQTARNVADALAAWRRRRADDHARDALADALDREGSTAVEVDPRDMGPWWDMAVEWWRPLAVAIHSHIPPWPACRQQGEPVFFVPPFLGGDNPALPCVGTTYRLLV